MAFSLVSVLRSGAVAPARVRKRRDGITGSANSPAEELPPAQDGRTRPEKERLTGPWPETSEPDGLAPNWPFVFLFFLALAIVQTYPLALHMGDHAIGWPGDSYQEWWNLAWMKHSLLSLSNPFHTNVLYYPQGSDLYLHLSLIHISEPTRLGMISYAVFCLKKKKKYSN